MFYHEIDRETMRRAPRILLAPHLQLCTALEHRVLLMRGVHEKRDADIGAGVQWSLIKLRDAFLKGKSLLAECEEHFAAASRRLIRYGDRVYTSYHRLVVDECARDLSWVYRRWCRCDPNDARALWIELSKLSSSDLEKMGPVPYIADERTRDMARDLARKASMIRCKMARELFIAWNRMYPREPVPPDQLMSDKEINPFPWHVEKNLPQKRAAKPAFARNNWFWNQARNGLTPARIRDKWNSMRINERKDIGGKKYSNVTNEVVKQGIKAIERYLLRQNGHL